MGEGARDRGRKILEVVRERWYARDAGSCARKTLEVVKEECWILCTGDARAVHEGRRTIQTQDGRM